MSLSRLPPFLARTRPWPTLTRPLLAQRARRVTTDSAAGDGAQGSRYKHARNSMLTPTMLLVGFVPVLCFGLGLWQIQRLQWKVDLIDELQEKLEREPLVLPPRLNLAVIPEFVYRKVLLRGTWDHAHSMLIGPRVRDGTHGVHLITPLVRTGGSTVLVDRGFLTKEQAEAAKARTDSGEVELVGMLRTTQARNAFTPDNDPERGVWYWADLDAMAAYAGGEAAGVQPVFVEAIFEGHGGEAADRVMKGVPIGRTASIDLPNSHLTYLITWFSLSAFTTFGYGRLWFRHGKSAARGMPRR